MDEFWEMLENRENSGRNTIVSEAHAIGEALNLDEVSLEELSQIGGGFQIKGKPRAKKGEPVNLTRDECLERIRDIAACGTTLGGARNLAFTCGKPPDHNFDEPSKRDLAGRDGESSWEISHGRRY